MSAEVPFYPEDKVPEDEIPGFEEYKQQILKEARREAAQNYVIDKKIKRVSFISISNGRGRKPRRSRGVDLLKVGTTTYQIKGGEVVPRKGGGIKPDVMANEVLNFLPGDERTPDKLLELLDRRP